MGFQILLTLFIVIAVTRLVMQFLKKSINWIFFTLFLCIWFAILFLNWNNALLNKIGNLLGLARGVDLIIYLGFVLIFYYMFVSLIKFYKIEQDINKLMRREAVEDFLKRYDIKNEK